ncbi:MAG: 50S ribosomal protein L19e [Methanomassiliicoccales archaeon]|jgi:large subunit ribosomal protein L19e|nr:50S ribosomal protein L19e [Methanomassiliicoccales archaeon]
MDLKNQKRMASEILGCGKSRVWIDPNRAEDVEDAITRADIRTAIESGTIRALPKQGVSRGRTRYKLDQRSKGRRRGPGSRKGTSGARKPTKRNWIQTIRPIRQELRQLRDDGRITRSVYRSFYMKAKGGQFKNRKNLLSHLQTEGLLKEVK